MDMNTENKKQNNPEEKELTIKEKIIAGLKETIETVVFVVVMVVLIRFFISPLLYSCIINFYFFR